MNKLIAPPCNTRESLINAAAQEFNQVGFENTHSNKIARLAGFAPQTFYRHFSDKTDIFIAVYQHWEASEFKALEAALLSDLANHHKAQQATQVILQHHRDWSRFRQSLRSLSWQNSQVRTIRNKTRLQQAKRLSHLSIEQALAVLLNVEAQCDALVDQTISDLKISANAWQQQICESILPALLSSA